MNDRKRPTGYAVTEKNQGFADTLFKIVQRIDSGEPASDWAPFVGCIAKAMQKG